MIVSAMVRSWGSVARQGVVVRDKKISVISDEILRLVGGGRDWVRVR